MQTASPEPSPEPLWIEADLSHLSSEPQGTLKYGSRERYLWELFRQNDDDPSLNERPEQMRAELHDRLTAPLYPLVIAVPRPDGNPH